MNVTAHDLMKGMWFALESCGEGLQAASDLLERGRYARSVALAMAARDELGKVRLLRQMWGNVQAGGTVTLDYLRVLCGQRARGRAPVGHVMKQQASQVTVTLEGPPGDPVREVMERQTRAAREINALRAAGAKDDDPVLLAAYDEWNAAEEEMNREAQARAQRIPTERQALRNKGLYLDVTTRDGRITWNRPNEIGADEATRVLQDAWNDYRLVRHNLDAPFGEPLYGRAFADALAAWPDKPAIP